MGGLSQLALGLHPGLTSQLPALNRTPLPLGEEPTSTTGALTFFRAVDSQLGTPQHGSGGSESSLFLQETFKGIQQICMRAVLRRISERIIYRSWWQP